MTAAEEEFRQCATGEEIVAIASSLGRHRETQRDQAGHAGVATAGTQAHICAEGEADEKHWQVVAPGEPIDGRPHIFTFATALVVFAFAEPGAAEVEAQGWESERLHRLGCAVDDLIVHGSTALGVRVAYECGATCAGVSFEEERFEAAGWARDRECLEAIRDGGHQFRL